MHIGLMTEREFLDTQSRLLECRSVEQLLTETRRLGTKQAQADDVEIALMSMVAPSKPGQVLYYEGEARYSRDQLAFVDRHSANHPLFDLVLAGTMVDPLEPEDAAGLAWRDNPMFCEVYQPCVIERSLFTALRVAPGYHLTIKAVRQKNSPFSGASRRRLALLQKMVQVFLLRCELLAQLCQACSTHKMRTGAPASNGLGYQVLGLTPREGEVLHWVEAGKTDPEIAIILNVNARTVHTHVAALLRKLDCENRLQLIVSQFGRLMVLPKG